MRKVVENMRNRIKIALLGGTGNLGKGLAMRLAIAGYEVTIGSRKPEKAKERAKNYSEEAGVQIKAASNSDAALESDIAIFAIPWEHAFDTAMSLKSELKNKIVVSPLVPMRKVNGFFTYLTLPEGSAAEKMAKMLPESVIISAFHSIPAVKFADLTAEFDWDVPVCGDDEEAKKKVINLINSINGLRGLDAGPLSMSSAIEQLTPLILNISLRSNQKNLGVKFL